MDGIKVVATLLTIWGFASYLYQQYLDDNKPKEKETGQISGIEDSKIDGIADKLVWPGTALKWKLKFFKQHWEIEIASCFIHM